jgi:hypothetical protein
VWHTYANLAVSIRILAALFTANLASASVVQAPTATTLLVVISTPYAILRVRLAYD